MIYIILSLVIAIISFILFVKHSYYSTMALSFLSFYFLFQGLKEDELNEQR